MKLKIGDQVLVLQGKDKGKKGKVEKVFRTKEKVLVSGVNIYKKHVKKAGRMQAGIIEVVKPLNASKVAAICPKCNLSTRIGFVARDNRRIRICKKCKQEI